MMNNDLTLKSPGQRLNYNQLVALLLCPCLLDKYGLFKMKDSDIYSAKDFLTSHYLLNIKDLDVRNFCNGK